MQGSNEHRQKRGIVPVLLLLVVLGGERRVNAQVDTLWIDAVGHCRSTEVTPEEGWKRSLREAEVDAIRNALGLKVIGETFQITSESMNRDKSVDYLNTFSKLNTTTTSGRIVREEILDSALTVEGNIPTYSVKIRALVAKDKGDADPNFRVDLKLDRDTYYDRGEIDRNDAVKFSVHANQDCYLYLFDIMANDTVALILPNAYFSDNLYSAEGGTGGFDRKIDQLSLNLRVGLPPGKEITTEMLYLVALKKKIDFYSSNISRESVGVIPTYQAAILDLRKWLVRIPQDLRTTSSATFVIKRWK